MKRALNKNLIFGVILAFSTSLSLAAEPVKNSTDLDRAETYAKAKELILKSYKNDPANKIVFNFSDLKKEKLTPGILQASMRSTIDASKSSAREKESYKEFIDNLITLKVLEVTNDFRSTKPSKKKLLTEDEISDKKTLAAKSIYLSFKGKSIIDLLAEYNDLDVRLPEALTF